MSGICGIINWNGAPVEPTLLHPLAQAAAHRGPDGIHYWVEGPVGLAHLALKITPESLRERQPLVSQDGNLVLVADARIDNRAELIQQLTVKGELHGAAPTDADLILAAYRCWGLECPYHLIGDFAFVIWDAPRQRLFAARDPLAMRPLYYRAEAGRVLFASEIKQILAAPNVPIRICEPMVALFLAVEGGPEAMTFYEGVLQLPAAHALVVDRTGARTWCYWEIDPDLQLDYKDEEEYYTHFRELFVEAVHCRLRSVSPVGLFLSGGMDSGSIASTAGWLLQQTQASQYPAFRTYSYAFTELPQCDERQISDQIVRAYHLPAMSIPVENAWPLKDYPLHTPDRDEPLMGAYQVMINHTLKRAKADGVRVMMTGGYGDHMVGGSTHYYQDLLQNLQWRTLWQDLRKHAKREEETVAGLGWRYLGHPLPALLWPPRTAEWLRQPMRRLLRRPQFQSVDNPPWVCPAFLEKVGGKDLFRQDLPSAKIKGIARRQRHSWFNSFEMRLETWTDRNYATYGLCHADPWSDRRIMSFVFATPPRILGHAGEYKPLAQKAMRGIMPEEVRQAAGKTYPAPLYERAMTHNARDTVLSLLTDSVAAQFGFLDECKLKEHYGSILNGGEEHNGFWPALLVEMWLRQHWI